MSGSADHTAWHELVAAHALHALDPDEERLVLAHLAGCDECRAELDAHTLTASHLASLAGDAETAPPPYSSIRAAVVDGGNAASSRAIDLAERRALRRTPRWLVGAAAVAVVVAGATVASWQVLASQSAGNHAPVAIAACGTLRGCEEIDLRSSDGVRRAAVIVAAGRARVQPLALQPAARGRTFVLWQLPRGGAPIPLGEFGSTTVASSADPLVVPMAETTAFAVSSEPAGVPPSSPTQVVALGGATS